MDSGSIEPFTELIQPRCLGKAEPSQHRGSKSMFKGRKLRELPWHVPSLHVPVSIVSSALWMLSSFPFSCLKLCSFKSLLKLRSLHSFKFPAQITALVQVPVSFLWSWFLISLRVQSVFYILLMDGWPTSNHFQLDHDANQYWIYHSTDQ